MIDEDKAIGVEYYSRESRHISHILIFDNLKVAELWESEKPYQRDSYDGCRVIDMTTKDD